MGFRFGQAYGATSNAYAALSHGSSFVRLSRYLVDQP